MRNGSGVEMSAGWRMTACSFDAISHGDHDIRAPVVVKEVMIAPAPLRL